MQGNGNTHIGFNSYIHGNNDMTVGNRLNLLGSNVYMFGPQADPKYYSQGVKTYIYDEAQNNDYSNRLRNNGYRRGY